MRKILFIKFGNRRFIIINLVCLTILVNQAKAQQFNSDSWLSKPWGTVTIIPTVGQRNSMLMTTYSLFPRWEFTVAGYMYNDDNDPRTNDGYSVSLYGKYMFYENSDATGGASVKAGTGMRPGTISADYRAKDAFKSYFVNFPCTIPFFNNKLSVDLMPGTTFTTNYGETRTTAWGFTYSTRLAYYPFDTHWAVVPEVFGTEGQTYAQPEYKFGIRWEPSQYAVFAVSYGQEFHGNQGAGFEFGIMLFSPPFACFSGCKVPKN
ncbi:MAG TPA: hypothetical protein VGN20_25285 [Mucilaginibacter sp.]